MNVVVTCHRFNVSFDSWCKPKLHRVHLYNSNGVWSYNESSNSMWNWWINAFWGKDYYIYKMYNCNIPPNR